ncbi:AAA family ATPase [Streptomyces leeuwenhoekii]|jgi:DNA-binding CsgD family transcriptional regulator|uniref:AAA family ATPase n=1 Tax=Streptomyces leeuwenhoekii TaxID=1437453 RepID=UPI0036F8D377
MRGVSPSVSVREPQGLTFLGLGRQSHAVRTALEDCAAGRVRVLVVEGGLGCGKSALLGEALKHAAASGFLVLRSAGCPPEGRRPFDLLRQLAVDPDIPGAQRSLLQDAVGTAPSKTPNAPETPAAQRVRAALHQLTGAAPVVIGIDDLHHADPQSLHCLLQAVDHPRATRLLLLCTALPSGLAADPAVEAELLCQPALQRVMLGRLSLRAVSGLRAARPEPAVEALPADDLLAVTGGNPLLVHALLEELVESHAQGHTDERAGRRRKAAPPVIGGRFYQAVLASLSRTDSLVRHSAGALAVLGDAGCAEVNARLLGIGRAMAARGLRALEATGLTVSGRFRHPVVEAAALDTLDHDHRAHLHRRAAALLYDVGAEADEVARHLLAARHAAGPWAMSVLRDAAEQLLMRDDVLTAISCLDLARRSCAGGPRRAEILLRLTVATRRTDPAAAEDHLAELVTELRAGRLTSNETERLGHLLLGCGRLEEATEVMGRPGPHGDPPTPRLETGFHASALWEPLVRPRTDPEPGDEESPRPRMPVTGIWDLPGDGTNASASDAAEHVLRSLPLTDTTLVIVVNAVRVLCRTGSYETAALWCTRLLGEAASRGLPGWKAQFLALQAEIALCRGLLADTEEYARQALACVPRCSRSVFVGGPLASRVFAATAMGRYDEATRQLDHPVPEALFRSVYGPAYLRARGHYYLALDRPLAAVRDFLGAGRLLRRWGIDRPTLMPWRSDAAEAFLRLCEPRRADRLLREQLARTPDDNPHVRGVSLRLRAQVADPPDRLNLLTEAVNHLKSSGDRLALAGALADLGAVYRERGESTRAGATIRRAWHLANDCGARALCERILPGGPGRQSSGDGAGRTEAALSGSELRVVELAANGHTNREIAARLCITVSTVEQHLTRAYRKLEISRRQELPARLCAHVESPV